MLAEGVNAQLRFPGYQVSKKAIINYAFIKVDVYCSICIHLKQPSTGMLPKTREQLAESASKTESRPLKVENRLQMTYLLIFFGWQVR